MQKLFLIGLLLIPIQSQAQVIDSIYWGSAGVQATALIREGKYHSGHIEVIDQVGKSMLWGLAPYVIWKSANDYSKEHPKRAIILKLVASAFYLTHAKITYK